VIGFSHINLKNNNDNSEYKEAISIRYVKDRIARGSSVGFHEGNRLIAWGMTQDDGGMGFLHVLPEYRRMKHGYNVTLRLIEELRKKGKTPFVYIEKNNFKSRNLALSLCFKEQKGLHWFQVN
jgi:8-oxo-dGTP diphosphatase